MNPPITTWILLRGLTREQGHWGQFAAEFAAGMAAPNVVALDLPGNGQFYAQRSPCSVQAMVAHCRKQLAQQNIAPPYGVLAMSLGAMVSAAWGQACPQEVAAQVLINTSMRPFSPFYQRLRPANYGALLQLLALGASALEWERAVLRLTSQRADSAVLPAWLAIRSQRPVSRANAVRQLIAAARFRAASTAPPMPVLVLASQQDQLVNVQCSVALAKQWQCAVRVHSHAGHDLPLDDGPWVIAQVKQWLTAANTAL
jgi:pimeloyl-ACP methyl ester carboxylesterase